MWPFFKRKKEKFLLLDVSPGRISGLLMSLDDKKKIKKEKVWENMDKYVSSGRAPVSATTLKKIIVACAPELALKILAPLSIKRENTGSLEKIELENLLAQEIGKVFNHYRRQASIALGIDELDTILAESNVSGFEIDGHKIINPLGFEAKEVNAVLELTFISRATFEKVKAVKTKAGFFFTEKIYAQAAALKKTSPREINFLFVGRGRSYFYSLGKNYHNCSRTELKWSIGDLVVAISKQWSLSGETGFGIYEYYVKEGISPVLEKHVRKIISGPVKGLRRQVRRMKTASKIYVSGRLPARVTDGKPFYDVPVEDFFDKSGFNLKENDFSPPAEAFVKLAPFLEFYYDNKNSEINSWLKRRLHWLGSAI